MFDIIRYHAWNGTLGDPDGPTSAALEALLEALSPTQLGERACIFHALTVCALAGGYPVEVDRSFERAFREAEDISSDFAWVTLAVERCEAFARGGYSTRAEVGVLEGILQDYRLRYIAWRGAPAKWRRVLAAVLKRDGRRFSSSLTYLLINRSLAREYRAVGALEGLADVLTAMVCIVDSTPELVDPSGVDPAALEVEVLALSHRLVAESRCLRTQAEAYERLAWLLEGPDADAAWAESGRMWHLVGDLEKIWMWTSGSAWAKFHASDLSGAKRHYTEALALADAWELSDAMERELRLMRQAFDLA